MASKLYSDWPDKSTKHTISYAQHKKNVAAAPTRKIGTGPLNAADVAELRRRGTLAKWKTDPSLRSRLPSTQLTASQRQQRALNLRLGQPIVPGSTITERDLARQSKAATQVEFGPEQTQLDEDLRKAQQIERDTGTFYDQYLQQLQANQRSVNEVNLAAQNQLAGVASGITGMDTADLARLAQPAAADAAARGAQAGDLTALANQATTARQALIGSFQAQQSLQGFNAQQYANALAERVGPGQKLSALAAAGRQTGDVRDQLLDLARRRGAADIKYRGEARADERKNVIAQQSVMASAGLDPTTGQPMTKALSPSEQKTQAELKFFNKHGYFPSTGAPTGYGPGRPGQNSYGYSYDEWQKLPESKKNALRKKGGGSGPGGRVTSQDKINEAKLKFFNEHGYWPPTGPPTGVGGQKPGEALKKYASDFFTKYGVQPVTTPEALTKAQNSIKSAYSYVARLKAAGNDRKTINSILLNKQGVPQVDANGKQITKRQGGKDVPQFDYYPQQQQTWLQVANDLIWLNGKISLGTADMLHKLGYSTNILGLQVPGQGKGGLVLKPWTKKLTKVK